MKCEKCEKKRASKEYTGFTEPLLFQKLKVCRQCFNLLSENNLKFWEESKTVFNNILKNGMAEISAENLQLIKAALRETLYETNLWLQRGRPQ